MGRLAGLVAGALAGALVVAPAGAAAPDPGGAEAARRGAAYLATRQGDDGSVPKGWRPDQVAETVVALVAGGGQEAAVERALRFLEQRAPGGASNGPLTGRIVSGLVAAGRNPRTFAGTDFVARLQSFYDPVTGAYRGEGYNDNLYADGLAMLGILAARADLPEGAVTRLTLNQCSSGGWSWRLGCTGRPDTDTTALVLSVLAAARGRSAADVREAREWLLDTQNPSGCWGLEAGQPDNANSCGLALSAITALGEDPRAQPWREGVRDPVAALRALQLSSGAFQYRKDVPGANDYATVQAVPGLAGWAYPVRAPAPASDESSDDGGGTGTPPSSSPEPVVGSSPAPPAPTDDGGATSAGIADPGTGVAAGPRRTSADAASSTTSTSGPAEEVPPGDAPGGPAPVEPRGPVRLALGDDGGGSPWGLVAASLGAVLAPLGVGLAWRRRRRRRIAVPGGGPEP